MDKEKFNYHYLNNNSSCLISTYFVLFTILSSFFFLFEKIFEILLYTYKNYFFKKASHSNVTIPMSM